VAARAARAPEAAVDSDPIALLRRPEAVEAYPAEPSDELLAAALGLEREQIVRYDLNTLGGGPLPGVAAALAAYEAAQAIEYGDLSYARLRAAIGELHGVDPAQVVIGAGADELIRLVATMALGPGDASVIPTPTFGMFAVEVGLAGARTIEVPRRDPAQPQSIEAIRAAVEREAARLAWLCTPNNPTGDRYELDQVCGLADGLPALVLVDEVYLDFAEAGADVPPGSMSAIGLLDELPNLLVLRSLSKAYGLAGARVGYLVVPGALADRFDACRLPLSVAGPSEAMALGALADRDEARRRHRQLMVERDRLAATLRARGCVVLDTLANFVTFRPPDAERLAAALAERGLIVRDYPSGPMTGWLRATARAPEENDHLMNALGELLP
jgi:histidinol-phosphate aminotransferase